MAWQVGRGYNRHSRGETQIGRWKMVIGLKLRVRSFPNQKTEPKIGAHIWMSGAFGAAQPTRLWQHASSFLVRRRPEFVVWREVGGRGVPQVAHPHGAVWVQSRASDGGHCHVSRTLQQACIGDGQAWVETPIACNHLVPSGFAGMMNDRVVQRRTVDLVGVEIHEDLVAILNQCDRPAKRRFRPHMANHKTDRAARKSRICH